jgi:hypothetical protein
MVMDVVDDLDEARTGKTTLYFLLGFCGDFPNASALSSSQVVVTV